jgi:hypothetical protein
MQITPSYLSQLSKVFSPALFDSIVKSENKKYKALSSCIVKSGFIDSCKDKTLSNVLDHLYYFLNDHYRCEYLYKNVIANQILIQRHNYKEAVMLNEFRANSSLADVVIVNGTSSVYEIKTELDSFDRLPSQLKNYNKIFDNIYVVTHQNNVKTLRKIVDPHIGIITLSKDLSLRTIRKAKSNKNSVDSVSIFNSLRKSEYLSVILDEFGYVPDLPNTRIHKACETLFKLIPKSRAHDYMVECLLNRKLSEDQIDFTKSIPDSIKMLGLNKGYSKGEYDLIKKRLNKKVN